MDVVNFFDTLDVVESLLDAFDVEVLGNGLEDENNTLPESQAGGPYDNDAENVGAHRVNEA